jgi:GTP-binding protein
MLQGMTFLDEATILVRAGDGGAGVVAFRREKYVPFGGPAGGDGGKGGDVVLKVDPRLNSLSSFQRRKVFKATSGKAGGNFDRTGMSGDNLVIHIPPGTVVRNADTNNLIGDLVASDQEMIVANGGRGGRGNARFKSSTNQAPRVAEKGEPGEERRLSLELKLIADVGIIGVPNAGKSTLLSVLSAAKPKIANYPFTTLTPNLGVVMVGDQEILFADIPGLVEGAHHGVGLGHSFLRHIQRTKILLHLLDGASEDPTGDFVQINTELALFDEDLAAKPQIVVLNKIDLESARRSQPSLAEIAKKHGHEMLVISASTKVGIGSLLKIIVHQLSIIPPTPNIVASPLYAVDHKDDDFEVSRVGRSFRVTGRRIERAAAMTYWEYDEAVERFQRVLYSLGVADALREAGVSKGDTVVIGDYELEWAE